MCPAIGREGSKDGGEGGIRTLGRSYPLQQLSRLPPSATRSPLHMTAPSHLAEGEGLEPYTFVRTPGLHVAPRRDTLPRSPPTHGLYIRK